MNAPDECKVWLYRGGSWQQETIAVVTEQAVALTVNGQTLTTLMCTPQHLEALALGFLFNEGWIDGLDAVADVRLCAEAGQVDIWLRHALEPPAHWRRTSGCSGGRTRAATPAPLAPPPADVRLDAAAVTRLMRRLSESQTIYQQTGGVHTSALSDGQEILLSAEDIGRHNSLDKLAGLRLLRQEPPAAPVLLTTGRISSEMLQKAYRMGVAVILSRTSPTSLSVSLAADYGLTLIGYARGGRFTVYTGIQRLARTTKNWPHMA